jgi:hypothetical protein
MAQIQAQIQQSMPTQQTAQSNPAPRPLSAKAARELEIRSLQAQIAAVKEAEQHDLQLVALRADLAAARGEPVPAFTPQAQPAAPAPQEPQLEPIPKNFDEALMYDAIQRNRGQTAVNANSNMGVPFGLKRVPK